MRRSGWSLTGLAGVALAGLTAMGLLVWSATSDPAVPFLSHHTPAHWIVDSAGPSRRSRPAFQLSTTFQQRFVGEPGAAHLAFACFAHCHIELNGRELVLPAIASWKDIARTEITQFVRTGQNDVRVEVTNDQGPPALWLSVSGSATSITDTSWSASLMGAPPAPARLAEQPSSGSMRLGPSERAANVSPWRATRALLPFLIALALVIGLVPRICRAFGIRKTGKSGSRTASLLLLGAALALVAALVWNNRTLDSHRGFDAGGHTEYINFVVHHHLPLADEGWEMFQPPFYYLGAAVVLWASGHTRFDPSAMDWVRVWNVLGYAIQALSLFLSLRLLEPRAPWRLLTGLAIGLFLPCQLYLVQYPTNELWSAALSSLAIALALVGLRRMQHFPSAYPFAAWFAATGAALGLAILTKFTAMVPLAVIVTVLTGRLIARRARPSQYLGTVGVMAMSSLVVCSWHYGRVAARFGRPFVNDWDRLSGYTWWQDPGEWSAGDFFRFGDSLRAPIWSAFHSIPDALYSTLWGDGLIGGSTMLFARPPWNYGLMAAGYILAILPTLAIGLGSVATLLRILRKPRAEDILILGLPAATLWSVLWLTLRVPSYSTAKAFYGLVALVPLAILAGRGGEILAGMRRRIGSRPKHLRAQRGMAVMILLGVWATTSFATYWMRGPDPGILANLDPGGFLTLAQVTKDPSVQVSALRQAVAINPSHPVAWTLLGDAEARIGDLSEAARCWGESLRVDPANRQTHLLLARVLEVEGRHAEAAAHYRWASALGATPSALLPPTSRGSHGS